MTSEGWLAVLLVGAFALAGGIWLGLRIRTSQNGSASRQTAEPAPADASAALGTDGYRLADHLDIGVLQVSRDGEIRAANETAGRMLQASPTALIGRSTIAAFVDHNVEELIDRARRQGSVQGELSTLSDPQRMIAIHAWTVGDHVLVALEDTTELRQLRRIRAEFIDNLAHELRTPLTTIRLLTESLAIEAERTELPRRVRDSIGTIDVETGHLVQMVNEILELSRIEGGASEMQFSAIDVDALITSAIERLRTFAERQSVTLLVEDAHRPEPLLVRGDEERLSQVLVNLLHNAIKFSSAGASVRVSARREREECVVSVVDDGVGIPRADVERVFERFYKVDKARHRGRGGTGLGLAIARHIVVGHGGTIGVQSSEGHGSTFSFTVPLARDGAG
jgi:two-component system phosphate regulon sensor histidine kinase PhoR